MTDQLEGQMSIFDLDTWCGKTCLEPYPQTTAKTSESSLKKLRKSATKMPLFLDLRKSGWGAEPSWEMDSVLAGAYMTHSFGESPKEENASRLSQILEDSAHQRFYLSARACEGLLRRAKSRGKILPAELETALIVQAAYTDTAPNEQCYTTKF